MPAAPPPNLKPGDPYCGKCGYALAGLDESSKCPECGSPFVESLVRGSMMLGRGKRFRTESRLFGLPILDVAFGPSGEERMGKPRGIIALGDQPIGFLAVGGLPIGFVSIGGTAIGVCTLGGASVGLLTATGGGAIGGLAVGGAAVGGIAVGGGAAGFIANGGAAAGYYAAGGQAYGKHTITPSFSDPEAVRVFQSLSWMLSPTSSPASILRPFAASLATTIFFAVAILVIAILAHARASGPVFPTPGSGASS